MKNILLKSLMVSAVICLGACDKKKELSDGSEMQTTTPHAMNTEPVQPTDLNDNHPLHDDMNSPASAPYSIENESSGVVEQNAQALSSTSGNQSSTR